MKVNRINSLVLEGAVALLRSAVPKLTKARLVAALKKYEIDEPAQNLSIERTLTINETCALLQVRRITLNKYIKTGRLRAVKLGRRTVGITPDSIREFLDMGTAKEAGK
jgi:excisionase family DNA binding protein